MAILNKTGITDGSTIQSEHVTRTIDALTGVSTDTIIATGSFTGSFIGALTGTASFATSASRAVSSSFSTTASYALSGGTSVSDYMYAQLNDKNLSGISTLNTKYYPLITGDVSASTGSVGVNAFMSPIAGTLVSMSIYAFNAGTGGTEAYRVYAENVTAKTATTNLNVSFTTKITSASIGYASPLSISRGDIISYSVLCSSVSMPTGSYLNVLFYLKP